MKKSKNQIIIAIYVLILVTLILLGFTYAYYKTRINGNTKDKSISVVSKKLEITYADGNGEITSNDFEPGSKITKTFSVKNTGDEEIYYSIALEDVINTFTRIEDIKYTLKKGEETIGTGHLPSVEKTIAFKEKINKNETNEYSLIVEYLNLDEDQSIDMG